MRMLMHVKLPVEPFNTINKAGTAAKTIKKILAETKPEAVYFSEYGGRRGAIMIVHIDNSSEVPALAEPWFLQFNAEVEFHIAMTPEELERAGVDALGKKWS